jgi:hypothetical protein
MFACLGAYPAENSMVVGKGIGQALIASLTRLSDNRGPNCHPLSAVIVRQIAQTRSTSEALRARPVKIPEIAAGYPHCSQSPGSEFFGPDRGFPLQAKAGQHSVGVRICVVIKLIEKLP